MERTCNVFKALDSDEHFDCSQSELQREACKPGTFLTGRAQVEAWEWWSHDREQ